VARGGGSAKDGQRLGEVRGAQAARRDQRQVRRDPLEVSGAERGPQHVDVASCRWGHEQRDRDVVTGHGMTLPAGSYAGAMRTERSGSAADNAVRTFHAPTGRFSAAKRRALVELLPGLALARSERPDGLDFGCGTGEALLARARAEPDVLWLGVDVHRASLATAAIRAIGGSARTEPVDAAPASPEVTPNVRLHLGDGVDVLSRRIDVESLQAVQILFPDPWPKAAHRARRLIQAPFVELLVSRLRRQGRLELATDDAAYGAQMLDVLGRCPRLRGGPVTTLGGPVTFYERRALDDGREVLHLRYVAG
jgi:tRNA (guanine-N7-)-methyltransferase